MPVENRPVIHLLKITCYEVQSMQWDDTRSSYHVLDDYSQDAIRFQADKIGDSHRLIAIAQVPKGYTGWFAYGWGNCSGGPLDKHTVPILHRAERKDVYEALSR